MFIVFQIHFINKNELGTCIMLYIHTQTVEIINGKNVGTCVRTITFGQFAPNRSSSPCHPGTRRGGPGPVRVFMDF